jgi:ApbE superfamily uncharacterized protein (UPF0280 family)
MWAAPTRQDLSGGRLHFQHGPIDIVLQAWGEVSETTRAYHAAWDRFRHVLPELASELSELRLPMAEQPFVTQPVALRMLEACRGFPDRFVTPMAAVAGAVADELMAVMRHVARLDRAFVNDGGDIALHLADGEKIEIGVMGDFVRGAEPSRSASLILSSASPVRGVATSGSRGRSFSLGVADSVTVLAVNAAIADAAATLIANEVDVDNGNVIRIPARQIDPDSDLGDRLVTRAVPALSQAEIDDALQRGLATAARFRQRGLIIDAALSLQGTTVLLDNVESRKALE